MRVIAELEELMIVSNLHIVPFKAIHSIHVLPNVNIVPPQHIVPLLEEVVQISWHDCLQQNRVSDYLERIDEDPEG